MKKNSEQEKKSIKPNSNQNASISNYGTTSDNYDPTVFAKPKENIVTRGWKASKELIQSVLPTSRYEKKP